MLYLKRKTTDGRHSDLIDGIANVGATKSSPLKTTLDKLVVIVVQIKIRNDIRIKLETITCAQWVGSIPSN